jgi:hypothetical protein
MNWDHPVIGSGSDPAEKAPLPADKPALRWREWRRGMPDVMAERRSAPRRQLVLAAEVVDLSHGARLSARTSDISSTGCYIDTLNSVPKGSRIRLRITHYEEVFEAVARVVYVSPGLGMGVAFENVAPEQQARLARWLGDPDKEF